VFLDRDGTLNRNTHFLIDFAEFELLPGVEEALRILGRLGYRLFVASNQSGVARGYFTYAAVSDLNRRIADHLGGLGISVEAFAFCPHHPEGRVAEYARACDCRKPAPGMLRSLAAEYGLDLGRSYMVGDNESDALAGINAGAQGVWLRPDAGASTAAGRLDNPRKIKEFASLLDFARNLRDFP
jgi:D-glycero-D-manno-heptose 1,7-bisphosphate phosphatase